jgi:hypothetical protein
MSEKITRFEMLTPMLAHFEDGRLPVVVFVDFIKGKGWFPTGEEIRGPLDEAIVGFVRKQKEQMSINLPQQILDAARSSRESLAGKVKNVGSTS